MISLRDQIEIHTSPDQVFAWLARLPEVYETWHPEHVSCRVLHGSMLEVGSEIECQEYLHGELHTMRFRLTHVEANRRIEFEIIGMGRGAFEVIDRGDRVLFVAELDIGSEAPIIGSFFDLIFNRLFHRRIEAMQQHMREEGHYLKTILEG